MEVFWIVALWIYCLAGRSVHGFLDLDFQADVSAIDTKKAELTCGIYTDKVVKEVIWYKVKSSSEKKTVYYYEPPKFNASSPFYRGRSHLADDQSSLVLLSVRGDDEGSYQCHVAVASNVTSSREEIPEESSATMRLIVNVPPSTVKMGSFTSGKNLTLSCQSSESKPAAEVTWYLTRGRETKKLRPAKVVTEYKKNKAVTVGYLYLPLTQHDVGVTIECVVEHPQTKTTLVKNVTMVPPRLLHPIQTDFDWLGGDVPYSTYEVQGESPAPPNGLVKMVVTPSRVVEPNSSVMVSVTSEGSFPEPSYTWWSEDLNLGSGRLVRIENLYRSQKVFCLVQNPVGSAVMSVQLSTSASGDEDPTSLPETRDDAVLSGGMVAIIAFGCLLLLLLVSFIIYYFTIRRRRDKPEIEDEDEVEDFDSFQAKQKPTSYVSKPASGQTKVSRHDDFDGVVVSTEKESLLQHPHDTPRNSTETSPYGKKRDLVYSTHSSTGDTSGYGDENGRTNEFETPAIDEAASGSQERAITKHLHDFDENASFVGDYGSRFGLDDVDNPIEDETRKSHYEQLDTDVTDEDAESFDSGASGIEGRYTLPHTDSGSWEHIDPNQTVGPQGRPIENN